MAKEESGAGERRDAVDWCMGFVVSKQMPYSLHRCNSDVGVGFGVDRMAGRIAGDVNANHDARCV